MAGAAETADVGTRPRVFVPEELAVHNSRDNCWVAVNSKVIDVTPVIASLPAEHAALADPLLDNAGTDISHWFDEETGEVRTRIDPATLQRVPYLPMGRFPHLSIDGKPLSNGPEPPEVPWWRDDSLVRGVMTRKMMRAWIVNVLTEQRHRLVFGAEETLEQVRDRFLEYNSHAKSYTWKVLVPNEDGSGSSFKPLDMAKTLEDNGVEDNQDEAWELGLDADDYLPVIHLSFNDDLTEG